MKTTTAEQNKATVRRYYEEIWCKGNVAFAEEVFAPDYVNIDPATPGGCVKGRRGFAHVVASYREAFPDLRMDIVEQFSDGDVVISRWQAIGTHKGSLMGLPATGRRGEPVDGVTISRFVDGKIVEDRAVWDLAGLMRQLTSP